jgi:hypothetical protein
MKFYQMVQKLLVGDGQADWWNDKTTFIFGKQAKNEILIYMMIRQY